MFASVSARPRALRLLSDRMTDGNRASRLRVHKLGLLPSSSFPHLPLLFFPFQTTMPTHRYRPIRQLDDRDHERTSLVDSGHRRTASDASGSLVLDEPLPNEVNAHIGAKRAEASTRVYGTFSKWALFVSSVFHLARFVSG